MIGKERSVIIRASDGKLCRVRCIIGDGPSCKVLAERSSKKTPDYPKSVTLQAFVFPGLRTSDDKKSDFLRQDPDSRAIDWTRCLVQCAACEKQIRFKRQRSNSQGLYLYGWLSHKVRCKKLQEDYKKEMRGNEEGLAKPDSPPAGSERTAVFRIRNGELRVIRCIIHPSNHVKVLLSSSGDTDERMSLHKFLTDRERLSVKENIRIIKRDRDVRKIDWKERHLWCGACDSNISFACKTRSKYHLTPWLDHKVRCQDMQLMLSEEMSNFGISHNSFSSSDSDFEPEEEEEEPIAAPSRRPRSVDKQKLDRRIQQRLAILETDPLVGTVDPERVWCKPCNKWIRLYVTSNYIASNWMQHKGRCHANDVVSTEEQEEEEETETDAQAAGPRTNTSYSKRAGNGRHGKKKRLPDRSDSEADESREVKRRKVDKPDCESAREPKLGPWWFSLDGLLEKFGDAFLGLLY
ncbi:hypothetical protein DFH11DRAFT_738809 [Phellopilus nigrolimitatus]|nr:hypothetical protein DFH11DRAFT_738809 [Phellopilus nigrolimitatus]